MRAADNDPDMRVIVVTGVGRAFCAGIDVMSSTTAGAEDVDNPDHDRERFYHATTPPFLDISRTIKKPTIAMVNGAAVGMGMDIALHCDIRSAASTRASLPTRASARSPRTALSIGCRGSWALGRALQFLYTGELKAETPTAPACSTS